MNYNLLWPKVFGFEDRPKLYSLTVIEQVLVLEPGAYFEISNLMRALEGKGQNLVPTTIELPRTRKN